MDYISKKDPKKIEARKDFEENLIPQVREHLKEKFGKKKWIFQAVLVGSAKRNLILVGNEGFDLDYQLRFDKMPAEYLNDAKNTKMLFKRYFEQASDKLGLELTACEDSTHVLTMKKIIDGKVDYSYDIAIMRSNEDNRMLILKNEKKEKSDDYHYVELEDCEAFKKQYKQINTAELWQKLRDIYKAKKEAFQSVSKNERPHSISLLGQAISETLQKEKSQKTEQNNKK